MNNFQQIEDGPQAPKAPPHIERQVKGDIGFLRNITYVLDLYMPRLVDAILEMMGRKESEIPRSPSGPATPREPGGSNGSDEPHPPIGPSGPGLPPK